MMEGKNMDIQIMLEDKKTYLIDTIDTKNKTATLKHTTKTVDASEILAVTYCPSTRIIELSKLFQPKRIKKED